MSDTNNRSSITEAAGPPLPHFGMEGERIPEWFGEYRVLAILARGMALVYKAEQRNPRRVVALKIPRGGALLSAESRRRFLREVELAAQVNHAGVVPVLEAGEVDGVPYYSMPFIEGWALDQYVAQKNPDLPARINLFRRLCAVAQTLHAQDLVHRDLKPGNVLVDRNGDIRLLDFGLAKAIGDAEPISGDQALLGTLQYMAPEQTRPGASRDLAPAADVYALGMILYQLVTNELPYRVDNMTREQALALIREAKPKPPSHYQPALSRELEGVILACLRKDARERPPRAGDMLQMIDAALVGQPTGGARRPARRRLALIILAGGVILLVLAGLAIRMRPPVTPLPPPATAVNVVAAPSATTGAESLKVEVVEPDSLNAVQTPPVDLSAGFPARLWPLHERLTRELRDDFQHRNDGALILDAGRDGTLWLAASGKAGASETILRAGQTAVIFAANGTPIVAEWQSGGNVVRQTATATTGKVGYLKLE